MITVAAGVLLWALPGATRFLATAPNEFWPMAAAALIVDIPLYRMTFPGDLRVRSTLSVCFALAVLVLWGAAPAILVQAIAGAATATGQRFPPAPSSYMVARLICAAAAAGLVLNLTRIQRPAPQESGDSGRPLLTFAVLSVVWLAVTIGLYVFARSTVVPGGMRDAFADMRTGFFATAASVLVSGPLLAALPGWWSLLIAAPLLTWSQIMRRETRYERWLATEPTADLLSRKGLATIVRATTTGHPSAQKGPQPFGVVLINFEAVQGVSRTLGRELHEKVIATAARRVIDAYGKDRTSLLSNDEIAIIVPGLTEATALEATEAAVALLRPVIEVEGIPFAIDPAGGAALSPADGRSLDELLIKAGLAADESRRKRRSGTLYVHEATDLAEHRISLLRELHATLLDPARHHEIAILYQPQVNVTTAELTGVEALLRWTHPQWGPIPPDELIAAVEPSKVMHELTQHVLKTVVAQMQRWYEQGDSFRVSVNVSIQDLYQPDFAPELGNLLRRHGIPPRQLLVEITETTLIVDTERVSQVARTLSEHGVGLSLDDFGTGYASIQQLRELPLAEVKIDQSYVRGIADNPAHDAIMTSLHQLAQALDIDVVAEGVEDQRTVDALVKLPGTTCQGWHFGRPMTVEDLQEWRRSLARNR